MREYTHKIKEKHQHLVVIRLEIKNNEYFTQKEPATLLITHSNYKYLMLLYQEKPYKRFSIKNFS